MKKRICSFLLALALGAAPVLPSAQAEESQKLLSVTAHQAAGETYVQLTADGSEISFSALDGYGVPFVDENGRTQIPIRKFAEAAGGTADWDGKTRQVTVTLGEHVVSLTIGEKIITKNGEELELDTAACIVDGSTYIPLRAAAEALGYTVEYSQRNAVLAALRLNRDDIVSVKCQAHITGGNIPPVELDPQQISQMCELFNQACMTSDREDGEFFLDTVQSYSGSCTITLRDGSGLLLMCRGENEIRYSADNRNFTGDGDFLLIAPGLYRFLMNTIYPSLEPAS